MKPDLAGRRTRIAMPHGERQVQHALHREGAGHLDGAVSSWRASNARSVISFCQTTGTSAPFGLVKRYPAPASCDIRGFPTVLGDHSAMQERDQYRLRSAASGSARTRRSPTREPLRCCLNPRRRSFSRRSSSRTSPCITVSCANSGLTRSRDVWADSGHSRCPPPSHEATRA